MLLTDQIPSQMAFKETTHFLKRNDEGGDGSVTTFQVVDAIELFFGGILENLDFPLS